jgi:hypothetical protein
MPGCSTPRTSSCPDRWRSCGTTSIPTPAPVWPSWSSPGLADRLPSAPLCARAQPVELVWSHLKRSLANLVKRNLAELTALVKTRMRRMQYRPGLLDGFRASTGLDLTPISNT